MAYPEFDGFSLQDGTNYIVDEINYRTIPERPIDSQKIARRPGIKLLANEFAARKVNIRGFIIGSSISDLQAKIDNLHNNITRKSEGSLYVTSDRYATAMVVSVGIDDPRYSQDFVPYDIEFLLADPFFYKNAHSVSWSVASGSLSTQKTITISGSVFAEPSIKYYASSGSGQTTTSGVIIEYEPTGETITWSGTGATTTLAYSDDVTFDYINHLILEGTGQMDVEGVFSRWVPGSTDFTVTFSGSSQGGTLEFSYQPRYL